VNPNKAYLLIACLLLTLLQPVFSTPVQKYETSEFFADQRIKVDLYMEAGGEFFPYLYIRIYVKVYESMYVAVEYDFFDGKKWRGWRTLVEKTYLKAGQNIKGEDFRFFVRPENDTRGAVWICIWYYSSKDYRVTNGKKYYNVEPVVIMFPYIKGEYPSKEIAKLRKQVSELRKKIQELNDSRNFWIDQAEYWKNMSDTWKTKYYSLLSEYNNLKTQLSEKENQIKELQAELTQREQIMFTVGALLAVAGLLLFISTTLLLLKKKRKTVLPPPSSPLT